jgi:hypothetical protein
MGAADVAERDPGDPQKIQLALADIPIEGERYSEQLMATTHR